MWISLTPYLSEVANIFYLDFVCRQIELLR
ncbi:hypothetical protein MANES_01G073750v8 [Manihot esculenta]|uniref:Uncharacterized protein n=1 Tax=Manihot esculenta TaxID=3983 RepID=A0ACB7ICP4_MANES|nr:hypothetical protein MANES_01G073750v8 [Manihot esculenta]